MGLLGLILVIVLIAILLGAFPKWPHSRQWGYRPFGIIGTILIIILILWLFGVL